MGIFIVEKYIIKAEKLGEFATFYKETLIPFMERRKDLTNEIKSHKIFLQSMLWGGYVEITEFENLSEFEKYMHKEMQDNELMTKIYPQFLPLVVPGTHSMEIWNTFP